MGKKRGKVLRLAEKRLNSHYLGVSGKLPNSLEEYNRIYFLPNISGILTFSIFKGKLGAITNEIRNWKLEIKGRL